MNYAIFYDTETTGLPLYKEPSEHPDQPQIVQLAVCLVNLDTRKAVSSIDVIVRPDSRPITAEMTAIHGITHEHAMDVGVGEGKALEMLAAMWDGGRLRIGHNESFDARIVRIAQMRHRFCQSDQDDWEVGASFCTQRQATPILTQARHALGLKGKTASLGEAYELLMGKPLIGAHSAMTDARACMDVYFAIKDREQVSQPA